jgi:hypothetical protein
MQSQGDEKNIKKSLQAVSVYRRLSATPAVSDSLPYFVKLRAYVGSTFMPGLMVLLRAIPLM